MAEKNIKDFGRLITAMATPFDREGRVDYARAAELAGRLVEQGSDGLVVHGTTGESPTVTSEETKELYRTVLKAVGDRAAVIAGSGSNDTAHAIRETQEAEKIGVHGALIVVPYYNRPSQEGMKAHFKAIASATKLPIMIYNIPGRTGVNMLPDTVAALARVINITSIKESSGNLDQIAEVREKTPAAFRVYSGDDNLTFPILERGGYGVVSVASHIAGREIKQMIDYFMTDRRDEAKKIHEWLMPLFQVLFITANPTPLKAALEMIGFPIGGLRLPLIPATENEKQKIRTILSELKLLTPAGRA